MLNQSIKEIKATLKESYTITDLDKISRNFVGFFQMV